MKNKRKEFANPWQTMSSREIYRNQWMRLREDQVITPGGKKGIYGVVETSPAIGIVPLDDALHTYLVGQYRYALKKYSWEIPEGGAEPGETLLAAAKRELREETGLIAGRWTKLGTLYTSNSITNEVGHLFLAEKLKNGTAAPEHTEALKIKKVPFLEAYRQVLDFRIKDALAVIGIRRVHDHLKKTGRL